MPFNSVHHDHFAEFFGIGGVIGSVDVYLQIVFGDIVENSLSIEGAIVIAHAGMVAADDEVCAAGVLTEAGMKNGFAGTGIQHVKSVSGNHYGIGFKIKFYHFADAIVANVGRNVAFFQFSEQHVDQDTVRF